MSNTAQRIQLILAGWDGKTPITGTINTGPISQGVATIAAEIDGLTAQLAEARANTERWHSELEECQSALRLALAGTEQKYFAIPARIDDVRAALAEARAEVERLRPAAEAWEAWREYDELIAKMPLTRDTQQEQAVQDAATKRSAAYARAREARK